MRNLLLHNFWWKLLSLLLAALTWLTIETTFKKDENFRESPVTLAGRRTFIVPIRLLTTGANTNDFKLTPPAVEVEVEGDPSLFVNLQPHDVSAFVDLTDVTTEKNLQRQIQVHVPQDLRVESRNPEAAGVERIITPK